MREWLTAAGPRRHAWFDGYVESFEGLVEPPTGDRIATAVEDGGPP